MKALRNFEVKEIQLGARTGADITDCVIEALSVVIEENKTVVFTHTGRTFRIVPAEVVNFLMSKASVDPVTNTR